MRKKILLAITIVFLFLLFKNCNKININPTLKVGQAIDSLNHVIVYYNGGVGNVEKRNTKDGYNLGLEYQCVEFVKRYYYEFYNHKMPDSYGHAYSFYNKAINDGEINPPRGLVQYSNPSTSLPQEGDLIVMNGTAMNKFGHVAIISKVEKGKIEIIQQNPGPFASSRVTYPLLKHSNNTWEIKNNKILGWLRMFKSAD